ncbi:YHS domain family OS=Verrucomicrobiae bacterium DG1235 GN=VDG1235_3469 PE=4 SV=1: YHS [Gemmataceae bacterium]|nr:YHS domain family OS=Verrucomicrobiae bacterium DG1235 GN=VDG1235_3469 PE=4 SV=1: YHS [Gemmataceae bacterium]VTU00473.1 YHS domain family OS=Verrucomicrobiae bacterium DG1235 GN=VDG1235_3469 PE=4 SV=1: YHS [Gemmataceae bacterium]
MTATARTALVVAALALCGPAVAAPLPNEKCPVMPTEKAVPEFHAEHQGRTVYFCCAGCVAKFRANPGPYLANLPPASDPPAPTPDAPPEWRERALEAFLVAAEFCDRHRPVLTGVAVAGLAVAAAGRARRRLVRKGSTSRSTRALAALAHPSAFLVIGLAGLCGVLWQEMRLARDEVTAAHRAAEQHQSAAQRANLADSAKLLHWAWPRGFHELPKGVRNTYYRGNDERSDKLFNGGNYRTATFRVVLKRADGSDAEPGTRVEGEALAVRLDVTRAPNTADVFFKADQMTGVFVTSLEEQNEDSRPLRSAGAGNWTVEVPVPPRAAGDGGYTRLGGVWAVSVGDPKRTTGAGTIHYYIRAVLYVRDGVLLPESVVWMVAVYPSPILHGPHADGEWFSDRPIPEIPDGRNATEPKLLGAPEKK